MEINKKVEIVLTKNDLEILIKDHFKNQGYDVKNIYFNIRTKYDGGDWRSEFPYSDLDSIKITC